MTRISDVIGLPALLEQLAEEAVELAKAALKMSRLLRGENPTPKTKKKCIEDLMEEIADLDVVLHEVAQTDIYDGTQVVQTRHWKYRRWIRRLDEAQGGKE